MARFKISVVLCTYNGEKYLPEQLTSILRQNRLPDEMILSDDASSDETLSILSTFARNAPFQVIVRQQPQNLGSTLNFADAIAQSSGDIIVLADQDDIWYVHKLEALEHVFDTEPSVGVVFSDADVVGNNLNPRGYTLWQSLRFSQQQQEEMRRGKQLPVMLKHPVVTGATMAFRSRLRSLIYPIPKSWVHDEWIALVASIFAPIYPLSNTLIKYRQHGANQISAEPIDWRSRLQVALNTDPKVYRARSSQYSLLLAHVNRFHGIDPAIYRLIDGKIQHLRFRGGLPDNRAERLFPILWSFLNMQYGNYTNSPLNALRDLLLTHPRA